MTLDSVTLERPLAFALRLEDHTPNSSHPTMAIFRFALYLSIAMSIPEVPPLSEWTIDDIIPTTELSWRIYRRSKEAGLVSREYRHFSHLAYTLHSILGTVEGEFQRPNSVLTWPESNTRPLATTIADCKDILRHVRRTLDRREGIDPNLARSRSRRGLSRSRHTARSNRPNDGADLSALGTRLTNRITIIMLQLDLLQVTVVGQVQSTLDAIRQAMNDGRIGRQSSLYDIIRRVEPLRQEGGSDFRNSGPNVEESWSRADEEIWEELRQEFIDLRFSRSELHRCRRVLMTYIKIKNEEGGAQARSGSRRGRPSLEEAYNNRASRGRQEESRGRRTSRRQRSSTRPASRWSSSFETLADDQGSPSPSRHHLLSTIRRETGLNLTDRKLFYGVLGAAAAASLIYVVHEVHRSSRREHGRSRR
ncbi:hypothetical protein BDZ45DRAFT_728483 [Acephala macrosclerotiorum]|nr:hypothetical protein BDZ45DRAFT_728483 [Acephala macrosclerotiorum]